MTDYATLAAIGIIGLVIYLLVIALVTYVLARRGAPTGRGY